MCIVLVEYDGIMFGDMGGCGSILKMISELSIGDLVKIRVMEDNFVQFGSIGPLRMMGTLDLFGYLKFYIWDVYYLKSLCCKFCVYDVECEGMHINYIRVHGYRVMQSVVLV